MRCPVVDDPKGASELFCFDLEQNSRHGGRRESIQSTVRGFDYSGRLKSDLPEETLLWKSPPFIESKRHLRHIFPRSGRCSGGKFSTGDGCADFQGTWHFDEETYFQKAAVQTHTVERLSESTELSGADSLCPLYGMGRRGGTGFRQCPLYQTLLPVKHWPACVSAQDPQWEDCRSLYDSARRGWSARCSE